MFLARTLDDDLHGCPPSLAVAQRPPAPSHVVLPEEPQLLVAVEHIHCGRQDSVETGQGVYSHCLDTFQVLTLAPRAPSAEGHRRFYNRGGASGTVGHSVATAKTTGM